jgi:hypothetical protein
MRNLLFFLTTLVLSACNLTAPGSPVEVASPTGETVQTTLNLATPSTATLSMDKTDWVTYTNTQNGYTIQRPRSVTLVEENEGNLVFIDDQISVGVSDSDPEEASSGAFPSVDEASDMMVGQYAGRRLRGSVSSIGGTPQTVEQVVIPHNDRFYVFTVYELRRSTWNDNTERTPGPIATAQLELFNNILDTVRFESE